MNKSSRISQWLDRANLGQTDRPDRHYSGYFICFNRGDYYEAHDVLEQLWLRSTGEDHQFYKGLIQLAGAFVHLKKHAEHPGHPLFSNRLQPAARLFRRAAELLSPSLPKRHGLQIEPVIQLCRECHTLIEHSGHRLNPLTLGIQPQFSPEPLPANTQP